MLREAQQQPQWWLPSVGLEIPRCYVLLLLSVNSLFRHFSSTSKCDIYLWRASHLPKHGTLDTEFWWIQWIRLFKKKWVEEACRVLPLPYSSNFWCFLRWTVSSAAPQWVPKQRNILSALPVFRYGGHREQKSQWERSFIQSCHLSFVPYQDYRPV